MLNLLIYRLNPGLCVCVCSCLNKKFIRCGTYKNIINIHFESFQVFALNEERKIPRKIRIIEAIRMFISMFRN